MPRDPGQDQPYAIGTQSVGLLRGLRHLRSRSIPTLRYLKRGCASLAARLPSRTMKRLCLHLSNATRDFGRQCAMRFTLGIMFDRIKPALSSDNCQPHRCELSLRQQIISMQITLGPMHSTPHPPHMPCQYKILHHAPHVSTGFRQ